MKAYTGAILHVDLTAAEIKYEHPEEKFYRQYLGGSCMGAYYVMKGMDRGVDALSPESVIAFTTGPAAGAIISGASRHCVTAKSPVTGGIVSSEGGGYWAPELKYAGFDAVIITGKAAEPTYLWIHDGECELRNASSAWGKTTLEAQEIVRAELGDQLVRFVQIGTAGESLCKFANIVNECRHFNGRGGLGAVLGSKNIRGIAVRGKQKIDFFDEEGLKAFGKELAEKCKTDPGLQGFRRNGTVGLVDYHISLSGLPSKNWTSGLIDGQDELTIDAWPDLISPGTCFGCSIVCKRHVDGKKTTRVNHKFGGPEYETVGMCGPNTGITDKLVICQINETASKYGFDTISFGATISFLMECYEKGLINTEYTDGYELCFGNEQAVLEIAELTGKGLGFGKTVAKGSAELAKEIGGDSAKLLLTVKNKEMPAHMPQTKTSVGLMYALTPIGADHVSGDMDGSIAVEPLSHRFAGLGCDRAEDPFELNYEKTKFFWRTQKAYSLLDSACVCALAFGFGFGYDLDELVKCINMATGWKTNLNELLETGNRRNLMMRAFNVREGMTKDDDLLPEKMFTPLKGGMTDGFAFDRETFLAARDFYYDLMGFEGDAGTPSKASLLASNLDWVVDYLLKE